MTSPDLARVRLVHEAGTWAAYIPDTSLSGTGASASEAIAGDITVDPMAYINSLADAEQDAVLGKAGAEAVRNGADLNQIVNARRGMRPAQIGGRNVLITAEGTTRRGEAYRYLAAGGGPDVSRGYRRPRAASRPRLMPETIQQVARDRDDYLRLLRVNGYLR